MGTMFETLLQLPLFQGLAQEDFTTILEKVKLHFTKHKAGETIIKAGTPCRQLTFILKGRVSILTQAPEETYSIIEEGEAPLLIEPQSLFGMTTCYVSTYTALTDEVHSINISKSFMMDELFKYAIFRLNFMNIISNRAQTLNNRLWLHAGDSTEKHLLQFIQTHIERPVGPKQLCIKMEELARIINTSRINVSKILNEMQEDGLLELHRGKIVIPQVEKLLERDRR